MLLATIWNFLLPSGGAAFRIPNIHEFLQGSNMLEKSTQGRLMRSGTAFCRQAETLWKERKNYLDHLY